MNKKGNAGWVWIIIIILIIAGWLIINNVYVTVYSQKETSGVYTCENGLVKQATGGLLGTVEQGLDAVVCMAYPDSQASVACENNTAMVYCKVTIYQKFFSTK